MTKELKALEYIENFNNKRFFDITYDNGDQAHYEYQTIKDLFPKEFGLIEAALKRLEEHDEIFKKYDMKDLWLEPALYVIKNHFPMDIETQLKKFKALENIKRKTNLTKTNDGKKALVFVVLETEEEFDLLKEVLD